MPDHSSVTFRLHLKPSTTQSERGFPHGQGLESDQATSVGPWIITSVTHVAA
jgi:hypothetical protein